MRQQAGCPTKHTTKEKRISHDSRHVQRTAMIVRVKNVLLLRKHVLGWEAILRSNAVFIENAKGAKGRKPGIVVLGEGEGMVAVEPTMVGMATLR